MPIGPDPARPASIGGLSHTLTVRQALPADALDVLRWRNDPLTRAMSRTTALVQEKAHLAWYTTACKDQDRLFLIGTSRAKKVGLVRFDRQSSSDWEVSVMLAPEARGRGLARDLLAAGLGWLDMFRGAVVVHAEVRQSNAPSIRLFESQGFSLVDADPVFRRYCRY